MLEIQKTCISVYNYMLPNYRMIVFIATCNRRHTNEKTISVGNEKAHSEFILRLSSLPVYVVRDKGDAMFHLPSLTIHNLPTPNFVIWKFCQLIYLSQAPNLITSSISLLNRSKLFFSHLQSQRHGPLYEMKNVIMKMLRINNSLEFTFN